MKHLHFSEEELAGRRARACEMMAERGLDGLLVFRQESLFYLTGYDTFGYVFFQCLYLGRDGAMTLLTRAPDLRQAQQTSVIEDIRVWVDHPQSRPADDLKEILRERMKGERKAAAKKRPDAAVHAARNFLAAIDPDPTDENAGPSVSGNSW